MSLRRSRLAPKKVQTRRSVSLSKDDFAAVTEWCARLEVPLARFVELALRRFVAGGPTKLDFVREVDLSKLPTPLPRKGKKTGPKPKVRTQAEPKVDVSESNPDGQMCDYDLDLAMAGFGEDF